MNKIFKPTGDQLLVRVIASAQQAKSGVMIPRSAAETTVDAEVVAHAPDTESKDVPVKTGDTVIYRKGIGVEVSIDGEDYVVLRYSELLGVL